MMQEAEQVENKEPVWQQAEEAAVSNQHEEEMVQEKQNMQEESMQEKEGLQEQEHEQGQEQQQEESSAQQEFDLLGDMAATITTE